MEFPSLDLNFISLVFNLRLNSDKLRLSGVVVCCLDFLGLFNFDCLLFLDGLIALNKVDIVAGGAFLLLVAGRSVVVFLLGA